jgi:hypothetical protein
MPTRLGVWSTTFVLKVSATPAHVFAVSTQLRVRVPHSSTVKIHTEESYVFF